jgi:hypothetical protein
MPYLVRADVEGKIPPAQIIEALDDDNDGIEDAGLWDKIADGINGEIDGVLSQRYAIPLPTIPAWLRPGACVLACETLFQRRGIAADSNPFTSAAGKFRTKLEAIASGKASLEVGQAPAKPPISIITEAAGTVPRHKLNA